MKRLVLAALTAGALVGALAVALPAQAITADIQATPSAETITECADLWPEVYGAPNTEPLGMCQWNLALIHANDATRAYEDGTGVRIGIIENGIDLTHPDLPANFDLEHSCSFVRDDDPAIVAGLAGPSEAGNGDCTNKAALVDATGHGTAVASIIAAPVNGIGIAGIAPGATVVTIKACTSSGYCFAYAVADALRYAGDLQLDVVNLSLTADPFLFYCGNDAEQRALAKEVREAARYAQSRGVLLVAAHGNFSDDLQHPMQDTMSPVWPPNSAVERTVGNQCRMIPQELPGVVNVSGTGPVGYPGYTVNIASYSNVGAVEVAAPSGDPLVATGTVQDGVLVALPEGTFLWQVLESLSADLPGLTVLDHGSGYGFIWGTSFAAPHAAGVAALIKGQHPGWGQASVRAALLRTATPMSCPEDWEPLNEDDERLRCYGGSDGWTSFFGHGLVDAARAAGL